MQTCSVSLTVRLELELSQNTGKIDAGSNSGVRMLAAINVPARLYAQVPVDGPWLAACSNQSCAAVTNG
jgi:hypothetical protein